MTSIEDLEGLVDTYTRGGEWDKAEAAQQQLDAALADRPRPTMLGAALYYAQVGLPVFPCRVGEKRPATAHGCLDATTDADQIRDWWTRTPEANVAIATGHRFDVVDVDGMEGQASRASLWGEVFADVDAESVGKVLTPSPGGMHIYVASDGTPNGTHLAPSVDYRGAGGYVVAPPSITDVGTYRWLGRPHLGDAT